MVFFSWEKLAFLGFPIFGPLTGSRFSYANWGTTELKALLGLDRFCSTALRLGRDKLCLKNVFKGVKGVLISFASQGVSF